MLDGEKSVPSVLVSSVELCHTVQQQDTTEGMETQMLTTELPNLITATEASKLVGRDPRTIARWVRRDAIPRLGVVIAGRVYIRRGVLEDLLNGDSAVQAVVHHPAA